MKESGKFNHLSDKAIENNIKVHHLEEEEEQISETKNALSDREIRNLKSQKSLKELAEEGKAQDITRFSDEEARSLNNKHGRLEVVKVIHGTYGMNGALLRSYESGEYFVITARNSNLFYWV